MARNLRLVQKGGVIASFFFAFSLSTSCAATSVGGAFDLVSEARLAEVADRPVWRSLIHSFYSEARIKDPKFVLSGLPLDPYRELVATLNAFLGPAEWGDKHARCRFPARYEWLKRELNLPDSVFPQPYCSSYREYLNKVPVDEIVLVFASENVVSPSSMMGHTFLKLRGTTEGGRMAEHAFTYFTVLDSANVPGIIYRNIRGGMRGIFALQPYRKLRWTYLMKEERNLWEYSLRLTEEQRALIRAHIWELNGVETDYLFIQYNCATVTHHLLSLVEPGISAGDEAWITPVDVVKGALRAKLVAKTAVHSSDRWKMRMLLDRRNDNYRNVRQILAQSGPENLGSLSPDEKLFMLIYVSYRQQRQEEIDIPGQQLAMLELLKKETSDYVLDYTNYKNPSLTPGNSQVGLAVGRKGGEDYVGIRLLPASHRFTDDHRQFLSDSELRMFDVDARVYETGDVALERLTLYAAKSINPWSIFTPSMSGQWEVGLAQQLDGKLQSHLVLNLYGGLGAGVRMTRDFSIYGLYNVGMATESSKGYLYHFPEVGVQMDEIFDFKSLLTYRLVNNSYDSGRSLHEVRFCQSYYPSRDRTFLGCYDRDEVDGMTRDALEISYQLHF